MLLYTPYYEDGTALYLCSYSSIFDHVCTCVCVRIRVMYVYMCMYDMCMHDDTVIYELIEIGLFYRFSVLTE